MLLRPIDMKAEADSHDMHARKQPALHRRSNFPPCNRSIFLIFGWRHDSAGDPPVKPCTRSCFSCSSCVRIRQEKESIVIERETRDVMQIEVGSDDRCFLSLPPPPLHAPAASSRLQVRGESVHSCPRQPLFQLSLGISRCTQARGLPSSRVCYTERCSHRTSPSSCGCRREVSASLCGQEIELRFETHD